MSYSESVNKILTQISKDPKVIEGLTYWKKNKSALKYEDIENFSKNLGTATAKYLEPLAESMQPNEIRQIYKHVSDVVIKYANDTSESISGRAGIKFVPGVEFDVKEDINDMLDNLTTRLYHADYWEDVEFLTKENAARSITRKSVTSHMKYTSKKHSEAGVYVLISRDEGSGCCAYCSGLTGTYTSFDDLPSDFWSVHRNCTCQFHYKVGKTSNRVWFDTDENGNISRVEESE